MAKNTAQLEQFYNPQLFRIFLMLIHRNVGKVFSRKQACKKCFLLIFMNSFLRAEQEVKSFCLLILEKTKAMKTFIEGCFSNKKDR